jgi:hypothetical protein
MINKKTSPLLNQVSSLLKSYDKIAKSTGENFNIFTVMGMESSEVKTHSAIIGELLNPKGSHGLKEIPLNIFLQQVIKPLLEENNNELFNKHFDFDFENTKSYIEDFAGKLNEDKTEGGRIDIVIKDNKKAFLIENKIYADEQTNQLIRYKNFYPNAPIIFLTLFGSDAKTATDLEINKDYFIISYEEHVLKWLEECLKEAVKYPMLREVIRQYINLVKKLTHQTINQELKKDIMDLIKNNFLEAAEIAKNYNAAKNDVIKKFWDELFNFFEETLAKDTWRIEQNKTLIPKYNHLLFSHNENDKAYLYYRYNYNDGEVECGIILKNATNGNNVYDAIKKSNPNLFLGNFRTSNYQSVVWKKDEEYDFSDPTFLTKIFDEDKNNSTVTYEKLRDKLVLFIEENEELFDVVLKHLNQ